ncbi:MAG: hypothetical protein ACLQVI_05385 [Polyangiaceae bacterium]
MMALAPAATALADEPTAEQTAAARSLGMQGVQLADSGDCAHAIDPLTRAEALRHAPTTLERLGECHIALGKLVQGTEELNRVIHEPLPPNAPPAFTAAQDRAKSAIDAAAARIGKLRIHIEHPAGVKPAVKVDDELVLDAMLDADRPTDPGAHTVSATAQGMKPAETSVTLADAQSQSVALTLVPDPNAVVAPPTPTATEPTGTTPAPATSPAPESTPQAPPPEPKSKTPAFVALGVGVVGVAVGSIFGVVALGTKSTLDGECPNKNCPSSSDQSTINSLGTQAWVSTIGFGVGIVGLGVGTVLLVTGGSSSASTKTGKGPHVTPYFGPGSAGLTGTF